MEYRTKQIHKSSATPVGFLNARSCTGGLVISFWPEVDNVLLEGAAEEYATLWGQERWRITSAIEQTARLKFIESRLNCIVYEGISRSHPLILRASYSADVKKAALTHELCHRLIASHRAGVKAETYEDSLAVHKQLDLVLFDVWKRLWGLDFADRMVVHESELGDVYDAAWRWALRFTAEERQKRFTRSVMTRELSDGDV